MRNLFTAAILLLFLTGCKKEVEFTQQRFEKKEPNCAAQCPEVLIEVPVAGGAKVASDSINSKVFAVTKEILYFGEIPYEAKSYEELASSFMESYERMKAEHPEDTFGWIGKIEGKIGFNSDKLINIVIDSYMFTGGAHGYSGTRSLLFEASTGKNITYEKLFKNVEEFRKFAEKRFREKFTIPEGEGINSTGLMFENDRFVLPQNIFIKEDGILLLYNTYEIASYAEGQQQLFIPMDQAQEFLKF